MEKTTGKRSAVKHLRSIFILIPLCAFLQALVGSDEEEYQQQRLFREANTAYAEAKDYETAVKIYNELLERRGPSVELYQNLGNSHYKLKNWGLSRLNVERALALEPNHPDLLNNLGVLLAQIGIEPKTLSPVQKLLTKFHPNVWFIASWVILSFPLFYLLLRILINFRSPPNQLEWKSHKGLVLAGIVFFVLLFTAARLSSTRQNAGIVIADEIPLKQSPFEKATDVYETYNGELLNILEEHDNYYFCSVPGLENQRGWIPSSSFTPILFE